MDGYIEDRVNLEIERIKLLEGTVLVQIRDNKS